MMIQETLAVLEPIAQGGLMSEEDEAWLAEAKSWEPPLPLFNWYRVVKQLWEGVLQTAHLRYMMWHFQLRKHYRLDSESEAEECQVQNGSKRLKLCES